MIFTHIDEILIPCDRKSISPGCMVQHRDVDYVGTVISVVDHQVTVMWPDNASFNVVSEAVRTAVRRGIRQLTDDHKRGRLSKISNQDMVNRVQLTLTMMMNKGQIDDFHIEDIDLNTTERTIRFAIRYSDDPTSTWKNLSVQVTF